MLSVTPKTAEKWVGEARAMIMRHLRNEP
jgi:hypothetical protein